MIEISIQEKIVKTVFIVSVVFFILGVFTRLYSTYKISVASNSLASYSFMKAELEKEISSLVFKDCELSTLSYVEQKAYTLGFKKLDERVLSLNINDVPQVASLTQ